MNSIEEAIKDLKAGKMVILVDDVRRENEGDFVIAAEKIKPEHLNFITQHGHVITCLSMEEKDLKRLEIPLMTQTNNTHMGTAFTVSIEAAKGVTTGSSVFDRVKTIQAAVNPKSTLKDIVMPGHVFPLSAKAGGVFVRRGHTEGSVDLMRLAGLKPMAVISEIIKKDGTMARMPDLTKIAKAHKLKIISIQQIIEYRAQHAPVFTETASAKLPTKYGEFDVKIFSSPHHSEKHLVLTKKNKRSNLVRLHSECLTGDLLGSLRCDCGWQLDSSLKKISEEGGALLYMRQEGRGIGLLNKIKAYALQDKHNLDTVEANEELGFLADARNYIDAAQILHQLGLTKIKLLTNNPHKIQNLKDYGIECVERLSLISEPHHQNKKYLKTKREKLGHIL
jgi:3,4-dihydroxy 2-butanone 4-phosphate synthase/GTP cyclohydrolase II